MAMIPRAPQAGSYSNLKIYVSGFPSHVCNDEIEDYFSWFGQAKVIKGGNPAYQRYRPNLQEQISQESFLERQARKNYLILSCDQVATKDRILNYPQLYYQGSAIYCSDYKTGVELIIHNQKMNQRRCILRKVPLNFTRDDVSHAISRLAGPIESLFVYEPLREREVVRHYSVSITFKHRDSLTALLHASEEGIFFDEQRISVEKYCSKKKSSSDHIYVTNSTKMSLPPSDENVVTWTSGHQHQRTKPFVCSITKLPEITLHETKPSQRRYHNNSHYKLMQDHSSMNVRLNPSHH